MLQQPLVDRGFARAIAYKRIFTGTLALAAVPVLIVLAVQHGAHVTFPLVLAIAIFGFGGSWALRDGIRLRRELAR